MSVENPLLTAVDQIEESIRSLQKEIQELQKSIQPQVNALREKIGCEELRREEAIAAVFATATLEDLADPASALVLYTYGWDNGRGSDSFSKFDQELRTHSHLRMGDTWRADESATVYVPVLDVYFPPGEPFDEDELKRTAKYIELLFPAQEALASSARAHIYGEDQSFEVARSSDGKQWHLYQQYSSTPYSSSEKLVALLTIAYKHIALQRRIALEEGGY